MKYLTEREIKELIALSSKYGDDRASVTIALTAILANKHCIRPELEEEIQIELSDNYLFYKADNNQ